MGLRFADDLRHLNPKRFFSEEHGLEESVLDIIKRKDADIVIFVDACDMGKEPGEIGLMQTEEVSESVSTHKVPLAMLMALIRKEKKEPFLLGIQPKSMDFRAQLSDEVFSTLVKIEKFVTAAIRD